MVMKKAVRWKKCHVYLPADKRHGGSIHRTVIACEKSSIGQRNLRRAEHNAIVFFRFMNELEALLGKGREQRCRKKMGMKIVLGECSGGK